MSPPSLGLTPTNNPGCFPRQGLLWLFLLLSVKDDGAHSSRTGAGLISCPAFKILTVGPHVST